MSALLDDASTPPRPRPLTEQEIVDRAERKKLSDRRFTHFILAVLSVPAGAGLSAWLANLRQYDLFFLTGVVSGILIVTTYVRWEASLKK